MKRAGYDQHYSHLLPRKPPVQPVEDLPFTKQCRRCGAFFETRSRAKKRCDACAGVVKEQKLTKANERLKARRAEARKAGAR